MIGCKNEIWFGHLLQDTQYVLYCTASSHETLLRILSFRLVSGHDLAPTLFCIHFVAPFKLLR